MYRNLVSIYSFCKDNITEIENFYEAISDRSVPYNCHHRLETHDEFGNLRNTIVSREELISQGLYYNRPASELIFLKKSEHSKLHRQFSNIDGHRFSSEEEKDRETHAWYARNYRLDIDKYSKVLESNRKYQEKHKEEIKEYHRKYYEAHREEQRAKIKEYYNRLCLYNGETLTFNALKCRFSKQGIPNSTQEAKKYLISN